MGNLEVYIKAKFILFKLNLIYLTLFIILKLIWHTLAGEESIYSSLHEYSCFKPNAIRQMILIQIIKMYAVYVGLNNLVLLNLN
ncbi:hypothetical protein BpHYR1_045959 [Brachionus plicatilis]|uniref:Uncharacterized protein n=1 Tax=Brachionus plicatilis TaxID=10195 RepID=A0A3M7T6N4_BRAPC|nr:hypothetical protein BpHYR1_045959 [Brachionus plicatilis]